MAGQQVGCPLCGAVNDPRLARSRCLSCGAELDDLLASGKAGGLHRQRGVSIKWLGASLAIGALLTITVLFGVPKAIPLFDFEGSAGMLMAVPTWFLVGLLVGLIAPARTFIEPVVATAMVAIPTTVALFRTQTVKTMPPFVYVSLGVVGLLFCLIGAYLGGRLQFGAAGQRRN